MTTTQPLVDQPTVPLARADDLIGTVLGRRYVIEALVGTGGMARVYRAEDRLLARDVALKVFSADSPTVLDRQRQQAEVRTAAGLQHPAIVTLYDITRDERGGDSPVLVMQFVDSETLREGLANGALPSESVLGIGAAIAEALDYLHDRGIMHRDVKPGNILLPRRARGVAAMLSDFGIARMMDDGQLTTTGTVIGSASYLSPEQAQGRPLTPATDVYSLGLVLIECLTGERCFPGSGPESAVARLTRDPDVPDDVGDFWRGLLRRMTAREPAERPTAAEIVETLRAPVAASDTIAMSTPAPAHPRPRWPYVAFGLAVAALAAAAALGAGADAFAPPPVDYPAVNGQLGEYLERLQEAVRP